MKQSIIRTLFFGCFALLFMPVALFAQWSQDIQLSTDTTAGLNENMGQCLAVSGDSVHVVWEDNSVGGGAIFYKHSYDGGVTWSEQVRLTPSPSVAGFPSIAVSGATVHIAYRDTMGSVYTSYYLRSLDGGNTWDTAVSLGNYYWWPSITCDGQKVFVALNSNDPGNSEVWFRRSMDNGTTWDSVIQISNAPKRSEDPSIAAGGGYVHLAWNDNRTDTMQTWYRTSSDNGKTWGLETQLTHTSVFCYFPVLHVTGSNVDLAYGDRQTGTEQINFKQSTDFGVSWNESQQITNDPGENEIYPNIGRDDQNIYLTWWQLKGAEYIQQSSDGGATWDSAVVLVPAANTPTNPFIVDNNGTLHVIWIDSRSGSPEVYYRHTGGGGTTKLGLNFNLLDFASVDSGKSARKTFTITNSGSLPAQIDSITISGPSVFSIDPIPNPLSILAGAQADVSVSFNPSAAGTDNATLTIYAAESSPVQMLLQGVSVGSAPASVAANGSTANLLEVTPNPASSTATLRIAVATALEDVKLNFYDATARIVGTQYVGALESGLQSIPISLPPMDGVAFMRITSGGEMVGTISIAILR